METGSIVQLKAGGPNMVIIAISEYLNRDGSKRIWCQWFNIDGNLRKDEFKSFTLKEVMKGEL